MEDTQLDPPAQAVVDLGEPGMPLSSYKATTHFHSRLQC